MSAEAHTAALYLTLNELKDYAETVVAIKGAQGGSGQLPAACAAGSALLLRAREQERLAALHVAGLKEDSSTQRNRLDHDSLQLHNLVYEQQYYDKEIAACRAFKSAYTNEQIGCYDHYDPAQQSESDLLHAELQQRQALQQQLQQLQQQKEQLLRERNRVSTSYAELRQQVEQCHTGNSALVDATQPRSSNIQADAEAAQLLPLPLYIIYTQAAAAASVVGLPLTVSIEGNPAVAKQQLQQQLQQQQHQQQQQGQPGMQGEEAAKDAAAAAASAAPPPAQDSKRKRKQRQQEDQVYQLHPLSVRLDLWQPGSQAAQQQQQGTTLTFFYYTQLKLVGVLAGSPEDQELITNLFLGDVGDGLMLENVGVCSSSGALEFAEANRPCPFRWAQELGGVDVLASLPSSLTGIGADPRQVLSALSAYRSSLRLETFVDRLAEAQRGRQQLTLTLEQLARKEQPACSLVAKIPNQIKTYIHSWKHLSDVGVQLQGGSAPARQQLEAEAAGRMQPAWQPGQQQHSIQEEGEVAGDGGDITSQLLPGETAEEDLLQGLLEDDRAGGSLTGEGPGGDGDKQPQLLLLQGGQEAAAAAAEGAAAAGDYADLDPDFRDLLTEASAGSDLMPGEGGVDAATATSSGPERALTASHSLYRLVLKAPALEVHLHAKVFYNYPLVPPVFGVTKMLDTSSRSDPVPLGDVNEALELTQQANHVAVQDAAASAPSQVLALQVLRLRQSVDAMSGALRALHSKDLVDNLRAKQSLQGRERRPRAVVL